MSSKTDAATHHRVLSEEAMTYIETKIKEYHDKFERARNRSQQTEFTRVYFAVAMGLDMILKAGVNGIEDVELQLRINSYFRVRGQQIPAVERDRFMTDIRKVMSLIAKFKQEEKLRRLRSQVRQA